jgi:hypothetical protein
MTVSHVWYLRSRCELSIALAVVRTIMIVPPTIIMIVIMSRTRIVAIYNCDSVVFDISSTVVVIVMPLLWSLLLMQRCLFSFSTAS